MEMRKHVGQCNLISNICTPSEFKDQVPHKTQSLLIITGVIQNLTNILKMLKYCLSHLEKGLQYCHVWL